LYNVYYTPSCKNIFITMEPIYIILSFQLKKMSELNRGEISDKEKENVHNEKRLELRLIIQPNILYSAYNIQHTKQ